jgi:hypothetical protein
MLLRRSERLEGRITKFRPPAHPPGIIATHIAADVSTSESRSQKKQRNATPNTDSLQPAKYASVNTGRRKGKLIFMTEMPLEILFEIFAQLEPDDLLHLSRANKDLRNILINSNANFLWKMVYLYFISFESFLSLFLNAAL